MLDFFIDLFLGAALASLAWLVLFFWLISRAGKYGNDRNDQAVKSDEQEQQP